MISVARALKLIDREVGQRGVERIPLADAVGRVLAEDIVADSDLPPFDRSQMDGYALRSRDVRRPPVTLRIVGESAAGNGWPGMLGRGETVRIMTGAPVPAGADAVQRLELAKELNGYVSLIDPVKKGLNIVGRGKEVRYGDTVMRRGTRITPASIGSPASLGYARILVFRRPRVAIVPTGSEIVPIAAKPKRDQIRDSNSIMLKTLCEQAGAAARVFAKVGDDLEALTHTISSAARDGDIVITTGGVSVGKYDLTRAALDHIGARSIFERIALKPGKPTVFAKHRRKLFFGLPGNPVSAAVTFYLFVRRAIMLMQAAAEPGLQRSFAVLNDRVRGTRDRDVYAPARLATAADGSLLAVPIRWVGSSDIVAFAGAEALIIAPKGQDLTTGDVAEIAVL